MRTTTVRTEGLLWEDAGRPSTLVLSMWSKIVPATLFGLFLAELSVMLLFDFLNLSSGIVTALVDATLLTILILPGLYAVILLPIARLASQLAAAAADARFRAVVEAASDVVIVGDRHGRIVFANPAVSKMLGYSPQELKGAEIAMLVSEEHREQHRKNLTRFIEGKEGPGADGHPIELKAQSKEGESIPVEMTLSAPTVHAEGLIVGVIRDLRQGKRLGLYEALLPVCCVCGVIRDDSGCAKGQGTWVSLEHFVQQHDAARFSHTFCPKCQQDYMRSQGMVSQVG